MIDPDLWFTLYVLATRGAVQRPVPMTTNELGQLMSVSQQTASRRLARCAQEGLVIRTHTSSGMIVRISDRGLNELSDVFHGLEFALMHPEEETIIWGRLVTGLGEGAYYVEIYSSRFHQALGFRPFPGTLNVKVDDSESLRSVARMRQGPPLVVQGFAHEGRTFGDVLCYRVCVNDAINGAVVVAQRTHHSEDILEVIAPVNLREHLGLNDNSVIKLTLVPLHKAA